MLILTKKKYQWGSIELEMMLAIYIKSQARTPRYQMICPRDGYKPEYLDETPLSI